MRRFKCIYRAVQILAVVSAVCSCSAAMASWLWNSPAEKAMKAGVAKGVCVVILTGDSMASLPCDLAASHKMLVHVIATSDEAMKAAQDAVATAKLEGFVTVEKLPLDPLPYRNDLINLIVVDDSTRASKSGYKREEAMRIVAPLGSLCVFGDDKEITQKPVPPQMDEWTHDLHGPDGGLISKDKVFKYPIGYRWNAGLPSSYADPKFSSNAWSSTRGLAVTGGRCFTLSMGELENMGRACFLPYGNDQYVTCRDAFNGTLLWRKNVGKTFYGGLYYMNRAPFVVVGSRVYTAGGDGKLLVIDAATGETVQALDTAYPPGKILVDNNILVVATWQGGTKVGGLYGVDRRRHDFAVASGDVEAYDAGTLKQIWKIDKLATSIRCSEGVLSMVQREGVDKREETGQGDRPVQVVVGVDLKTGAKLWEVPSSEFGTKDYLTVASAGQGSVGIVKDSGDGSSEGTWLISAKDGKVLVKTPRGNPVFQDGGIVTIAGKKYNSQTGAIAEAGPSIGFSPPFCVPSYYVNGFGLNNRGGGVFMGARGACIVGEVPAYGCIYVAQNWCGCVPTQIQGFLAIGNIVSDPKPDEMEKAPQVEQGPAFNVPAMNDSQAESDGGWPIYRKDAKRSGFTAGKAPEALDVLWQTQVISPMPESCLTTDWKENLASQLTPPVVASGIAVAAASNLHQVVAFDANTGKEKWRFTAGGRIDSSPTIVKGRCIFGSHDGYLYALSLADGQLAWRMRMAPREDRMVSYGQMESLWPVIGTVVVVNDLAYAVAGRTQGADGGCVLRSFDPVTGAVRWSKALTLNMGGVPSRTVDLPFSVGDSVQAMLLRFDAKTGEPKINNTAVYQAYLNMANRYKSIKDQIEKAKDPSEKEKLQKQLPAEAPKEPAIKEVELNFGMEGFLCWNWTKLGFRKFNGVALGNFYPGWSTMIAWNDTNVCAIAYPGRNVALADRSKILTAGMPADPKVKIWEKALPSGYQATSIVFCANSIIVGGGIFDEKTTDSKGFVQILSLDKGEPKAEHTFNVPLAFNGLAVAGGKVFATLEDGSIVCLGAGVKPATP